jgi:uncharacterized protein DUF3850
MVHTLKVQSGFFRDIASGEVSMMIVNHDRSFVVGDIVQLQCFDGISLADVPNIVRKISYYYTSYMHPGVTLGMILLGLEKNDDKAKVAL